MPSTLSLLKLAAAASLLAPAAALPAERNYARAAADLGSFITSENSIALQGVLNNIGGGGSKVPGAGDGLVVASPSKENPNYFYSWTRDAALTIKSLVDAFIAGNKDLQSTIDAYIAAQPKLQAISNPSGGPTTGGLGEPKFEVNFTAFTGDWCRPQRDGPALRATALIAYANYQLAQGSSTAKDTLWPIIQEDLGYVVSNWNQTGCDLWEEVRGSSFFTLQAQHRALVEGAALAQQLGTTCDGCSDQASGILCFLQSFWNGQYIVSNLNANDGRTGLDVNSILSSIQVFDPEGACDDSTFQPCSSRALANHKAVTDSFRPVYSINSNIAQGKAVAVGRYASDVYMNGNPWYLATLAAAEQLYDAVYQWNKVGSITIDSVSAGFWQDLSPDTDAGTYKAGSDTFNSLIDAVKTYADGYFSIVQQYTPSDGSYAEQFSKSDGKPLSAVDLTWSYAAFLTAAARRDGSMPASWAEKDASTVPSSCKVTAPPTCSCASVAVTFNEQVTANSGESIFVAGSVSQLGGWNTGSALALKNNDNTWSGEVKMPCNTAFQYKFIRKTSDGSVVWESDPNRSYTVQDGGSCSVSVSDTWR